MSYSESGIKAVPRDDNERSRRLTKFLTARGITPTQYANAKAALASGNGTNAQMQIACAIMLDNFDVEAV